MLRTEADLKITTIKPFNTERLFNIAQEHGLDILANKQKSNISKHGNNALKDPVNNIKLSSNAKDVHKKPGSGRLSNKNNAIDNKFSSDGNEKGSSACVKPGNAAARFSSDSNVQGNSMHEKPGSAHERDIHAHAMFATEAVRTQPGTLSTNLQEAGATTLPTEVGREIMAIADS